MMPHPVTQNHDSNAPAAYLTYGVICPYSKHAPPAPCAAGKRKVYNAAAKRVQGTEAAAFVNPRTLKPGAKPGAAAAGKGPPAGAGGGGGEVPKWKAQVRAWSPYRLGWAT